MDIIYGRAVAWAAPFFLIAVIIEIIVDRARRTRYYSLSDAVTSVGCGAAFIGARVSFGFIGLFVYKYVLENLAPITLPNTTWWTWVFAFVLYDFCYYWWHRLSHNVAFLWGSHVVHHQSTEFNLTTALRQPASAFLTGWPFYLPLALCGVPVTVYLTVGIAQLLYQFWPHTRHIRAMGVLDRWIQTPSNHRVHHACNGAYVNKNYVGVFLIWDRMFGTFEEERAEMPCVYGVSGEAAPWNPLWANLQFYWALVSASWRTRSWLDKVRVWVAEPGWRPSDVVEAAQKPIAPVDRPTGAMRVYAMVQFAAVTAANQHFLIVFPRQDVAANALYFAVVLAGLTTASTVLEGRYQFFAAEAARLLLIATGVLATGAWLGGVRSPAVVAGIAVYVLASLLLFAILWRTSSSSRRQRHPYAPAVLQRSTGAR